MIKIQMHLLSRWTLICDDELGAQIKVILINLIIKVKNDIKCIAKLVLPSTNSNAYLCEIWILNRAELDSSKVNWI